jgi:hypothetical protein
MNTFIQWTPRTPDTFSVAVSELIRARQQAVNADHSPKEENSDEADRPQKTEPEMERL